jgi:putative transposase
MERTFKFRLYPKDSQIETMDRWLYLLHDLYNAGLQQRMMAYRNNGITQTTYRQNGELPELKKQLTEYRSIHSQVLQNVFDRLDKAYQNFFSRVKKGEKPGFPRFKPLKRYTSFTYPQSGFKILENGRLLLSGIGEIRMFKHRDVRGIIKTVTIKKDRVGDWFASFSVDLPDPEHKEQKTAVGNDLGLKNLVMNSDGNPMDNPRFLKQSEGRRKRKQRQLSKKQKGSHNRQKARIRLAVVERRIERQRDNYLHKASRELSTRADVIIFEDLNIENMVRNHHLAKSILDASWGKLVQYTRYKAEEAGGEVVLVDPKNTSQICSKCGGYVQKSLSERIHICQDCGFVADRDWNAALNILKIGSDRAEFKPVERGVQPEMAQPLYESGSSLL